MDHIWSQKSSVTRDFSLLSVVIVFIALLTSVWVTYETYTDQSHKIAAEMEQEALRIERGFTAEISRASYLLEAIGRQILQRGVTDATVIAQMLRSFDTSNDFYSVFLWVDADLRAVTSSRQGVLNPPVDLSDRAYVQKSKLEPFKIQVGRPIDGRISEKKVIPLSMGLTDYTGKYIGSVTLSLDLYALTASMRDYVRNSDIGYAILSDSLNPLAADIKAEKALKSQYVLNQLSLASIAQGREGMITRPSLTSGERIFSYYRAPERMPYVILALYNSEWNALNRLILPRLMQLVLVAAFLVSLLWLVRYRIIYPVQTLAHASSEIARGNAQIEVPASGPSEITHLSRQLQNIVDYIAERKRIEEELIAKVLALKTAKDIAEISDQAKMEILRSLRQEIFPALEQVLGASSILHDQPYGEITVPEYKNSIGQLDKSSTHLAEVVHEVFEFPKLMLMEPLLTRKPVDVGSLLHKCVTLLAATLQREEVLVHIRTQENLPKLAINELHLIHVVMHLLSACVHSIPAGGELTIEAMLEESGAESEFAILFKDNGTGLDTQHIGQLWRANEPVYRGSKPSPVDEDRASSANAITLTKKIIGLHNGRMTMQNPPGKEAIIGVYFRQ
jgi:two-component system, cell cycle sensor histidine kinase PleC